MVVGQHEHAEPGEPCRRCHHQPAVIHGHCRTCRAHVNATEAGRLAMRAQVALERDSPRDAAALLAQACVACEAAYSQIAWLIDSVTPVAAGAAAPAVAPRETPPRRPGR